MARARSGLGHGLEALVSTADWMENAAPGVTGPAPADASRPAAWEFATLDRTKGRRRRLRFRVADPRVAGAVLRQDVRGLGLLGALNALGSQGWELVAVRGSRCYLKRPAHRTA